MSREKKLIQFIRWHWSRLPHGGARFVRFQWLGAVGTIQRRRNIARVRANMVIVDFEMTQ